MRPSKNLGIRPCLQRTVEQARPNHAGFYILEVNSRKRFLVDTSATLSTVPTSKNDRYLPSEDRAALATANVSPIISYGTRTLKISIMSRGYDWPFLIADVKVPFLGADLLAHHGLLVDMRRKRLVNQDSYRFYHLSSRPSLPRVCSVTPLKYGRLLQEFPEVFKPELRQLEEVLARHGIFHHISTMGPPTSCTFRILPPQKLQDAERDF
ncbi:uncharacterized protein [Palaemon carinicauda]|uniref:uncharacterized protein n=1 Tax=Palaemon carinicauda TaxID=392227 RepID=UPI0035B630EA